MIRESAKIGAPEIQPTHRFGRYRNGRDCPAVHGRCIEVCPVHIRRLLPARRQLVDLRIVGVQHAPLDRNSADKYPDSARTNWFFLNAMSWLCTRLTENWAVQASL